METEARACLLTGLDWPDQPTEMLLGLLKAPSWSLWINYPEGDDQLLTSSPMAQSNWRAGPQQEGMRTDRWQSRA